MNVFYLSNKKEEDCPKTAGLSFSSDSAAIGDTYFTGNSALALC